MNEVVKKTYHLPSFLIKYFYTWCRPGRDYSTKIGGAILYYMTLPADVREKCEKLSASNDIAKVLESLQEIRNDDSLNGNLWNVPALPVQPEEEAILYSDSEFERFIDTIKQYRPELFKRCLPGSDQDPRSTPADSSPESQTVRGYSLVDEPKPDYQAQARDLIDRAKARAEQRRKQASRNKR